MLKKKKPHAATPMPASSGLSSLALIPCCTSTGAQIFLRQELGALGLGATTRLHTGPCMVGKLHGLLGCLGHSASHHYASHPSSVTPKSSGTWRPFCNSLGSKTLYLIEETSLAFPERALK